MDYHWDHHLYFIIIPFMHRLYSFLLTCLTLYVTHTTTDTTVMGRPVSQQIFFGLGKAGYAFFRQKQFVGII
jgi:hypothetical protein